MSSSAASVSRFPNHRQPSGLQLSRAHYTGCETCQTYRPPRTSHCRLCDVCTEQTDHHCSFLNNCIGRRNYSSFIAFLVSAVICVLFAIGVSIAHLVQGSAQDGSFWDDWSNIGSIALIVLTAGIGMPVMGLLCYHCRLMWISKTTIEVVSTANVVVRPTLLTYFMLP